MANNPEYEPVSKAYLDAFRALRKEAAKVQRDFSERIRELKDIVYYPGRRTDKEVKDANDAIAALEKERDTLVAKLQETAAKLNYKGGARRTRRRVSRHRRASSRKH
jgi:predicted DNA-binding ArsR family transcriptional regulator